MRIRNFQLEELARARSLQDEAAKLHIPVPVLSWQYEIKDAQGNIEEKGIGKSNSYTRSAINIIAYTPGVCGGEIVTNTAFGDGYVNMKNTGGAIYANSFYRYSSGSGVLLLGTSTEEESLDNYAAPSSGLSGTNTSKSSTFNTTTRKLITTITRVFSNGTASQINITESGITMSMASSTPVVLIIRDVFPAIPIAPGQTISWTYVTEVSYPNP